MNSYEFLASPRTISKLEDSPYIVLRFNSPETPPPQMGAEIVLVETDANGIGPAVGGRRITVSTVGGVVSVLEATHNGLSGLAWLRPGDGVPPYECVIAAPITFDRFQTRAVETAIYPLSTECPLYPVIGLVDEACEVADAFIPAITASGLEDLDAYNPPVGIGTQSKNPLEMILWLFGAISALGKVAGQVKKAYRNAEGDIRGERRAQIRLAILVAQRCLAQLSFAVTKYDKVVLPQVLTFSEDDAQLRDKLVDELGDVTWYLAQCCTELKVGMGVVALKNGVKLAVRKLEHKLNVDNR